MLYSSSTLHTRHSLASLCCSKSFWSAAPNHKSARRISMTPRAESASSMPRNERGERDATQAEKISGFAEKPLGFYDTSHIIRGPDGLISLVGLSAKRCKKNAQLLSDEEVNTLRNQTPGWRLQVSDQGQRYLRQEWKVKNFKSGLELFGRVALVAEEEGHHPDLHLQGFNNVAAELNTHSAGEALELQDLAGRFKPVARGLTENDFIIAARINAINFKDLLPKPKSRFWA